jgi:hypothetical protein
VPVRLNVMSFSFRSSDRSQLVRDRSPCLVMLMTGVIIHLSRRSAANALVSAPISTLGECPRILHERLKVRHPVPRVIILKKTSHYRASRRQPLSDLFHSASTITDSHSRLRLDPPHLLAKISSVINATTDDLAFDHAFKDRDRSSRNDCQGDGRWAISISVRSP